MKLIIATGAAFAIVIAALVWAWSSHRTQTTRAAVTVIVNEAAGQLKPALAYEAQTQTDFDAAARAAEAQVAALRKLDTGSLLPLADAADGYLVSVREILKRRAVMQSAGGRAREALEALTRHLQSDRGGAHWPREAVRLKEGLEREFREYRIATESYAALLETLPAAQARLSGHVRAVWIADEKTIRDARAGALDEAARTHENIRKVTQLDSYRGRRRQGGQT